MTNKWFVYMVGLPGSGKSMFARRLRNMLGHGVVKIVNWDTEKIRMFVREQGVRSVPSRRLWNLCQEWWYSLSYAQRDEVNEGIRHRLYNLLVSEAPVVLLDTVGYKQKYRMEHIAIARQNDRHVCCIVMSTEPQKCFSNIKSRAQTGGNFVPYRSVLYFWHHFEPITVCEYDLAVVHNPACSSNTDDLLNTVAALLTEQNFSVVEGVVNDPSRPVAVFTSHQMGKPIRLRDIVYRRSWSAMHDNALFLCSLIKRNIERSKSWYDGMLSANRAYEVCRKRTRPRVRL